MNKPRPQSISFGDVLTTVSSILMLVGFAALSWIIGSNNTPNFSGINLLSGVPRNFTEIIGPLYLLLVAIVGGLLAGLIGIAWPRFNRWTAIVAFAAGLVALAYFAYFIYRMNLKSIDVERLLGPGFWLAFIASFGLFVQILFGRSRGTGALPTLDSMSAALGKGLGIVGFLRKRVRVYTHVVFALLTVAACYLVTLLKPAFSLTVVITDGTGYLSLILIAVTLLIGPIKLLSQRRIPVNVDLRRDAGIWAGITGIIHVIFGLQVHMGGNITMYFFRGFKDGFKPDLSPFGLTNWIGAVATVILVVLLVLSNDVTLRMFKGPLWKLLQRFNYFLVVMVVAHTLLYQVIVSRESIMRVLVIALSLVILLTQALGFYLWRSKGRSDKAKSLAPTQSVTANR